MMNKKLTIILLALISLISCSRTASLPPDTIPLTDNMFSLLQNFNSQCVNADICIIGDPDRVVAMAEKFKTDDLRDNISGIIKRDSLPDFAGECFACILDSTNLGYSSILEEGDTVRLREITVHQCLMALDTICHLSPYDKDGLSHKRTSKIIVLASPFLSSYGKPDIDALVASAGSNLPVIGTFDSMCDRLFRSKAGDLNIGVISRTENVDKGLYSAMFQKYANQFGRANCTICEYEAFDTDDPLREFLDNYAQTGVNRPLDAILVDDYTIDVPRMFSNYKRMTSVMSGESLQYGKLLSKDFVIFDGESTVVQWCYRYLRTNNLFTHNIAWPYVEYFVTVPVPGTKTDDLQPDFMLIRDKRNVQK